jgi:hypothetical protein
MSIASVHYLSMNTPSGRVTAPTPEYGGFQYTYSVDSLAVSTAHDIAWGDSNTDASVSTNGSGVLSHTHTYAAPGTYEIVVTEHTGGRKVAQESVTVGVKQGTLVVPGSIIENVAASFTASGLDKTAAYSIDWGDGSSHTTGTTDSSGAIGATNHTFDLYGTYAVTVTIATVVCATGSAVVGHNDGTVTFGGAVASTVAAHLTGSSLAFSRSYDIDWGDGSSHDTVSTDGAGALPSTAHTYAAPGTFNVVVKDGTHTSATLSQVVS